MNRTYRALSALLLMQPALAQAPAWTTYGESAGDNFGFSMVTADDWNSDGVADLLVGSPGVDGVGPDTGRITLFSGATAHRRGHGRTTGAQYNPLLSSTAQHSPQQPSTAH